jgi:hypothetical protein
LSQIGLFVQRSSNLTEIIDYYRRSVTVARRAGGDLRTFAHGRPAWRTGGRNAGLFAWFWLY